jgi:hypothetical protein
VLKQFGRLIVAASLDVERTARAGVRRRDNGLTELIVGCALWSVINEPLAFVSYFNVGRLTVWASLVGLRSVVAEP